jgi:Raf kinase inhibitor-like YbhB/YbcL family protein
MSRRFVRTMCVAAVLTTALIACGGSKRSVTARTSPTTTPTTTTPEPPSTIVVTSSAFENGQAVPRRFTCDGENVSPPLAWRGVPTGTASVAVLVDDPDAQQGTFVHWVVVNVPPTTTSLPAAATGLDERTNSAGKAGWSGPCPPPGKPHHYRFNVYALRDRIPQPTSDILPRIENNPLAHGVLVGTYQR